MCSFASVLLSPEASGQQVLHKREDRALNCHLNVTVTQETDTLHRAILDIQDQVRKKVPEYTKNAAQNTIHQRWICSCDSRSTHCCHNHELCISLIWNIQLWAAGQTLAHW